MKIPTYDTPQVQQQAVAPPRMNPGAAQGAFGEALGAGMQNLGGSVFAVAQQQMQEANITRTEASLNEAMPKLNKILTDAHQVLGGDVLKPDDNGRDFGTSNLSKFDEIANTYTAGLTNDAQQKMFKRAVDGYRVQFQEALQRHEATQIHANSENIANGQTTTSLNLIQDGIKNNTLNPATFQMFAGRAIQGREDLARLKGITDKDSLDAIRNETLSSSHQIVLDGMMDAQDFPGAQKWLTDHKDEITGKVWEKYSPIIQKGSAAKEVNAEIDATLSTAKTLEEVESHFRKKYESNPMMQDMAIREADRRWGIKKGDEIYVTKDLQGKVTNMAFPLDGKTRGISLVALQSTPEWRALEKHDGDAALATYAKLEAFQKRNQNDPRTVEMQAASFYDALRVKDANGNPAWMSYNSSQVHNLVPEIGPTNATQLLGMIYQAQTTPPSAPKPVHLDDSVVESTMRRGGLIKGGKLSDDEKANVQDVEAKLRIEFTGKQPTPIEVVNRINELMKPIITKPENWFQRYLVPGDWNDKAPLFKAEQADPFTPNFYLQASDILMQKGGQQLSESDAQQLYLAYKNNGKLDANGNIVDYKPNMDNLRMLTGQHAAPPPQKLPKATARKR